MTFTDLFILIGIGILMMAAFVYLHSKLCAPNGSNWKGWAAGALSILLVAFSLAWAYASLLEHEVQAACMGLFVFGGPGLLAAVGAFRSIRSLSR